MGLINNASIHNIIIAIQANLSVTKIKLGLLNCYIRNTLSQVINFLYYVYVMYVTVLNMHEYYQ